MRFLVTLLLLVVTASSASAQVVYVVFRDFKIEKRYKKYLTKYNGMTCIIGEPKSGVSILPNGVINYINGAEAKNTLWVPDPAQPGSPPYEYDRYDRPTPAKKGKGWVVSFPGFDIQGIKYVDSRMTLHSYAREYNQRIGDVEQLEETLKGIKRGSKDWFTQHGRIVGRYERLQSWLRNVGYGKAADKMERTVGKQRKVIAKQASAARAKEAFASVKKVDLPKKLVDANQAITGGRLKFSVQESKHMRITYLDEVTHERVAATLELAEKIVEGFRREFVDPYVDDDFEDWIPEEKFLEFWVGPDNLQYHEKFLTEYYDHQWGRFKENEMAASGALFYLKESPWYLNYRKLLDDIDLEGYVAHSMGSTLADLHLNHGRRNDRQAWIMEGAGYFTALAYLGRNSQTTFADAEREYAQQSAKSGTKTAQNGLKGFFNQIALSDGATIEALALKQLHQLNDADYGKSWSVFDFIARREGKDGQVWLRKTCLAAEDLGQFMPTWRKFTEEMNPVDSGSDVFGAVEKKWKTYAQRDQIAEQEG